MRAVIPFCILLGMLIGLLAAYLLRRRRDADGWRCRNAKCGAVIARPGGKFCPACGTPRLPRPKLHAAPPATPAALPGGSLGNG